MKKVGHIKCIKNTMYGYSTVRLRAKCEFCDNVKELDLVGVKPYVLKYVVPNEICDRCRMSSVIGGLKPTEIIEKKRILEFNKVKV